MPEHLFRDRDDAGRALGRVLAEDYADRDALVLALPRGGVPVGFRVAEILDAPLDVLVVRKLGHPRQPELALGAIADGGLATFNEELARSLGVSPGELERIARAEREELRRRERAFRTGAGLPALEGRTVILVDDGVATGSTALAALAALRRLRPGRLVLGVPVAAPDALASLREEADEVVCLASPEPFGAVSVWYERFPQTTDEEVRERLERAARPQPAGDSRRAGA